MSKYNNNAAALTWEIINNNEDIGKWKLSYLKENEEIETYNGNGIVDFLNAANNLSSSINVVYVKKLRWFMFLIKNFIDLEDKPFFASESSSRKLRFFNVQITDNIELREWDNFFDTVEDNEEFLKRLDICRRVFVGREQKGKKTLERTYKTTLAREMWENEKNLFYLYQPWARNFCIEMAPQDEEELYYSCSLDRGGFYYQNPEFLNKVATKVHQFDKSSAYLSLLVTEKYPFKSFIYTEDFDEIQKIISDNFYCYYGEFDFYNLRYKNDLFKIDLSRFGEPIEGEANSWRLILTNVDIEWFKKCFEWDSCFPLTFYYTQQRELTFNHKEYAKMFLTLYEEKEAQKKGTFAKEIYKFRAQLPFGQPIKQMDYPTEVVYDKEINYYKSKDKEKEKNLNDIKYVLANRGIPRYISLWLAAYSRLEFFNMLFEIGFDKVIYGDTDSVKFVGEEGIKIVAEHNKQLKDKMKKINKKRNIVDYNEKLGQWCDEGDLSAFKAIGIKWYVTIDMKGELDVKASGADIKVLKKWLNEQKMPLQAFDYSMQVFGLFHEIKLGKNGKGIVFRYKNKMDKDIKKDILRQGTELYQYVPFKEG